ncbi:unnamed protein product, partial [Mesorhabditis belari]|uniref:SCP domain-containing protein n=1 Tax=Mesorhabditis belari TaxID=2138241 RepID=A0AAF3E889_9BILA
MALLRVPHGLMVILCAFLPFAFTAGIPHLFGQAETSHSGPTEVTDDLNENGLPTSDEEHFRQKRAYNYRYNSWYNNEWSMGGGLLVRREPPSNYLKKWITYEHNRYRRMVPATDMNMLYWSEELAASAQRHADTCDFRHSRGRVNVGENIWAAPYANYSDAISIWFNEVHNPWCGCNHAYKHCCGHYIQVVWAKTSLVGCGFARCRDVQGVWGRGHRNVFVCHYNPQGNTVPAFKWATGDKKRCSECPTHAPACHQGLCYMPSEGTNNTTTTTTTTTNSHSNENNFGDY